MEVMRLPMEERLKEAKGIYCNAQMTSRQLRNICRIDQTGHALLKNAMEKLNLSVQANDQIFLVARTIVDMDGSEGSDRSPVRHRVRW